MPVNTVNAVAFKVGAHRKSVQRIQGGITKVLRTFSNVSDADLERAYAIADTSLRNEFDKMRRFVHGIKQVRGISDSE